jgi:hypothetical protein
MKTYSASTRTLACVASQADTMTQNLHLHELMGAKGAGSGGMAGQGTFPKGRNFQPKSFSGRGRQNNFSNRDVNVAAADGMVGIDGADEVDGNDEEEEEDEDQE